MVVFTTSHFLEHAQDGWTHHREEYWVDNPRDPDGPPILILSLGGLHAMFKKQFHDPAIEEVHEKRMKELKMGTDPTTVFFQKLEREAKLARRWDDTDACRAMVNAA